MSELFYASRRKTTLRQVRDVQQRQMGATMDGDTLYHTVYFNPDTNRHISYDTVVYHGEHCYILGSGHERPNGPGEIIKWDPGNEVTWKEAQSRHTRDLIIT